MWLKKLRSGGRGLALWAMLSLALIIAAFVAYQIFRPYTWHEVIIDTGAAPITYADLQMCGSVHAMEVKPSRLRGQFPNTCEHGPTVRLATATAQYWCPEAYIDYMSPATTYTYKIENGECVAVGESQRPPLDHGWRSPPKA